MDNLFVGRDELVGGILALSTLDPLLPAVGVGDVMRWGGSALDALIRAFAGIAGIGGTSEPGEAGGIVPLARAGEGVLKVRSVIEPLLLVLCSPPRPRPPLAPLPLPVEDVDARRAMRFVWILPTGSGEVV